jgi:hypothetical protein
MLGDALYETYVALQQYSVSVSWKIFVPRTGPSCPPVANIATSLRVRHMCVADPHQYQCHADEDLY